MNKKNIIIYFLILTFAILNATWIDLDSSQKLFESSKGNYSQTQIEFTLDGYELDITRNSETDYAKISYKNEGETTTEGKPHLPQFTRLIIIPNHGTPEVEIIGMNTKTISNINILPHQGFQSESNRVEKPFIIDEKYYSSNQIYPEKAVVVGTPLIMRDYRIVPVTFSPFQYNPQKNELILNDNISINVTTSGSDGINTKTSNQKISRSFESMYKSLINYDSSTRVDEYQQPSYLIIVPNNSQLDETTNQLIEWKSQKGFDVQVATTAQTGSSTTTIKNYIQNAYNNWENPPEFVCIVGDAGGSFSIPTGSHNGGEGDQYYTLLEGNDIVADLAIGRLSFRTLSEYQTIVNKIKLYEKTPYMENTDWFEKAIFVGDPSTSGPSCVDTKVGINDMMNVKYPNFDVTTAYSGNYVSAISNAINAGTGFFNYRGYYGMSGWDTSDVHQLTNVNMLPVAIFITCGVGSFSQDNECRSEAFLRHGTPNTPRGAVAAIATATIHTHTCFNNTLDAGIYGGIFSDDIFYLGNALNKGKLNLVQNYPENPGDKVYEFSYWNNLMGDPALEVWTGVPQLFQVTYNSEISEGTNNMEIFVEDQYGNVQKNAWVTISKNSEVIGTNWTNDDGYVLLPINIEDDNDFDIVVTKHDFKPFINTISVTSQNSLHIVETDIQGSDENEGINPNENIEISFTLKNFGSTAINGVTANLTSENEEIIITQANASFGDIDANAQVSQTSNFEVTIPGNLTDESNIIFHLNIVDEQANEYTEVASFEIAAPNFELLSQTINGNQDYINSAQTADVVIDLENFGSIDAQSISGTLACDDSRITINENTAIFGNINSDDSQNNISEPFNISAAADLITGMKVPFVLTLTNPAGLSQTVEFEMNIGDAGINDPFGSDSYGYFCFDDEDVSYIDTPEYNWIEISSTGTNANLYDSGDEGDNIVVDLPMDFSFYGETYDQLTICSNGWISPGATDNESFMNWSIPNTSGPSPIIAVFWDDLRTSNGDVYYQYFPEENYFVVEWDNLVNDYSTGSHETFEVILYDSSAYPTYSGDSNIKMQYEEVHNVDSGSYNSYSVHHGQYATVGIENDDAQIGLEYTYNNDYPVTNKVLEDEMAIFFTTTSIVSEDPYLWSVNAVNFDTQFVGIDNTVSCEIKNFGQNDLIIEEINLNNNIFSVELIGETTIPFNETRILEITFSSSETGTFEDEISFVANNINSDSSISLSATAVHAAVISTATTSINQILPIESIAESNILLENSGLGNLNYVIDIAYPNDNRCSQIIIPHDSTIQKGEREIGKGATKDRDSGGPDNFGYEWIDSDDDNGPVFVWNDISTVGDEINFTIDDQMSSSKNLGFDFDYYENSYSSVKICSNGYISFTSNNTDWQNSNIPAYGGPSNMIAPFWDDLSPQNSGSVYFYSDDTNNTFTVQFDEVPHYPGQYDGTYSFQVILKSNGQIFFMYNQMTGEIQSASIGIENEDGSDGLQLAYNSEYVHDQMAVKLSSAPVWISCTNSSGTILPNESLPVPIEFNTTDLEAGTYNCNIIITSNDPVNPQLDIPVTLTVSTEGFHSINFEITDVENSPVSGALINLVNQDGDEDHNYSIISGTDGLATMYVVEGIYDLNVTVDGYIGYTLDDISISENNNFQVELESTNNNEDGVELLKTTLGKNYPNPFNPETNISFFLQEEEAVEIVIYNIKGQIVKTLVNDILSNGNHSLVWKGNNEAGTKVSSGVYYYQMKTKTYSSMKKMLLLK